MAPTHRKIPEATVARLPLYLRSLLESQHTGLTTISSERLAELAGVNAAIRSVCSLSALRTAVSFATSTTSRFTAASSSSESTPPSPRWSEVTFKTAPTSQKR